MPGKISSSKSMIKEVSLIALLVCGATGTSSNASEAEREDDIVCAFFYPWYGNPNTSSWRHWQEGGYFPPITWSSNYLPDYPDSQWNPSVQLFDSRDPEVLRWQDNCMRRAGVDIAVSSWWGIQRHEDVALLKAIRICKSVQWCIYYEQEGYGDPSPQQIYDDLKYIIDTYGPSRNYAKIDGKWLVFVYRARNCTSRWYEAKNMLAADGYPVYLNADTSSYYSTPPEPWDAIHTYRSYSREGSSETPFDDSAWISPGCWVYGRATPALDRSLNGFASAWNGLVNGRKHYRFILIETWNEWHEGTQIEPGQEIVPDALGFYPKVGGDYGYSFIDAIGPSATFDLHWESPGHRPVVSVRLEAEETIWDDDSKIRLSEEDPNKVLILEEGVNIGSSIFIPDSTGSNELLFTIRANAVAHKVGRFYSYPKMTLYFDDAAVKEWEVQGGIPQIGIERDDQDYSTRVYAEKGIHKVELGMFQEPAGWAWDLMVDFIDVNATLGEDPNKTDLKREGFETGDFSKFGWRTYGDEEWHVTSDKRNSGAYSAQAGSIESGETTCLKLTLDCASGAISFHRKVSSESGCDFLAFYIDGLEQDRWSGEEEWELVSFPVTAGRRTFRWEYSKDDSTSDGDDTSWIDDITFPRL